MGQSHVTLNLRRPAVIGCEQSHIVCFVRCVYWKDWAQVSFDSRGFGAAWVKGLSYSMGKKEIKKANNEAEAVVTIVKKRPDVLAGHTSTGPRVKWHFWIMDNQMVAWHKGIFLCSEYGVYQWSNENLLRHSLCANTECWKRELHVFSHCTFGENGRTQKLADFSQQPVCSRLLTRASVSVLRYEKVPVILVGNKVDLESEREVSSSEGQALAEEWGCPFMETSAKSKTMVDELFAEIVRQMDYAAQPDKDDPCCSSCNIQ